MTMVDPNHHPLERIMNQRTMHANISHLLVVVAAAAAVVVVIQ